MGHDIRTTDPSPGPKTGSGSGAANKTGYGAGGLGAGGDRAHHGQDVRNADTWDAPGVTPGGRRTGTAEDGPRIPMDGESEPDPDRE